MRKFLCLFFIAVLCMSSDITVSDIKFKGNESFHGHKFVLNGAGIREKYYIDLYVLGLYLRKKETSANKVLNANEPQMFRLVCVSNLITAEKFNEAMEEGFFNATNGNPDKYKKEIQTLKDAFSGTWKIGDEFVIFYTRKGGLELYKNNQLKATINSGIQFKTTVMKIWLGPKSVSDDLRDELLGVD